MKVPRVALGGASLALLASSAWIVSHRFGNSMRPPGGPFSAQRSQTAAAYPSLLTTSQSSGSVLAALAPERLVTRAIGTPAPRFADRPGAGPVATSHPSGTVVAIDPETGQLHMPTPEQIAELLSAQTIEGLNHSSEGPVEIHHSDGHVTLRTGGRYMEYAIASMGPDGKVTYRCVNSLEELRRALAIPPPAHAALAEK